MLHVCISAMLFSSANSFIPLASLAVLSSIVVSHASPLPETQLPIKDRSDLIAVGFDLTVDYGYGDDQVPRENS